MPPVILLVDDDFQILSMLRDAMEEVGYQVLLAMDGQQAIKTAMTYKIDLIILDVNMPMYNGLRTLEALRSMEQTRRIPVVLLTGAQSDTVYPTVEAYQQVVFIKKPVDLEHVHSTVKRLLESQSEA